MQRERMDKLKVERAINQGCRNAIVKKWFEQGNSIIKTTDGDRFPAVPRAADRKSNLERADRNGAPSDVMEKRSAATLTDPTGRWWAHTPG